MHKKLMCHPDKKRIIKMLMEGVSVREVAQRLKEMYPDDKKLHLSVPLLQAFRKDKLNLSGETLDAIQQVQREKLPPMEKTLTDNQVNNMLLKNSAYKEKLEEALNLHIDIRQQLANMSVLIHARMEDIFNRAQAGKVSTVDEQNLQRYFQTYITVIEKWAKYIDKIADHTIETNVNITVIEDQMSVIRGCIRETLGEVNPELAIKFFSKLEKKMAELSYRPQKQESFTEIRDDVMMLTEDIQEDTDE